MATKISSVFDVLPILAVTKIQCEFYKQQFEPKGLELMTIDGIIVNAETITSVQKKITDVMMEAGNDPETMTAKVLEIKEKFEPELEGAITSMAASTDSLNRWKYASEWAKYQLIDAIEGAAKCARELLKEMHEEK